MIKEKKIKEEDIQELYKIIVALKNTEDCKNLFDDMCTVNEVENMAQRIKAAKLLMENKTYTQIIEETDISSATLSRVSKCVQYGKGYTKALNKK